MNAIDIIESIITSFFAPGLLLILKKIKVGYIIYVLFMAILLTALFTNIMLSFSGLEFVAIFYLVIVMTSIILNFLNIKRPYWGIMHKRVVLFAKLLHLILGVIVGWATINKIDTMNQRYGINEKLEYLENFDTSGAFLCAAHLPSSIYNFAKKMSLIAEYYEFFDWKPGLFYLLDTNDTIILYQNYRYETVKFNNLKIALRSLAQEQIRIDAIPFYFAFSSKIQNSNLLEAFRQFSLLGIPKIMVVYTKDTANVLNRACNPKTIMRVRQQTDLLISSGLTETVATAKALIPLLKSCPSFMIDLDPVMQLQSDIRFHEMIKAARKNVNCSGCNTQNVIDFCIFIGLPSITFSVVNYDSNDLANKKSTLIKY